MKEFGVNISGYINKQFGLGEGVRSTVRSVDASGVPYVLNDFKIELSKQILDSNELEISKENPFAINIVQINPDLLFSAFKNAGPEYFKNRYNIAYWAWELEEFPDVYKDSIALFDEIWVPSSFCAEAISKMSAGPVLKFFHSIEIDNPTLTRADLGMPEDRFVFFTMFDYNSSIHRKNPMATIEAFEKAFGKDNPEVLLIIKSSISTEFPEEKAMLLSKISGNKSIVLIEEILDKNTLYSYMNCCDCFVSLHRSEGFGLTMAEAMYLGKPVIATAYSANSEFLNINNSFPVKYSMVETGDHYAFVGGKGFWANADTDDAAKKIKFVFENQDETAKISAKGKETAHTILSPKFIGEKMEKRLQFIYNEILPTKLSGEGQSDGTLKMENKILNEKLDKLRSYTPIKMKLTIKNLKNKLTGSDRKYIWED